MTSMTILASTVTTPTPPPKSRSTWLGRCSFTGMNQNPHVEALKCNCCELLPGWQVGWLGSLLSVGGPSATPTVQPLAGLLREISRACSLGARKLRCRDSFFFLYESEDCHASACDVRCKRGRSINSLSSGSVKKPLKSSMKLDQSSGHAAWGSLTVVAIRA